MALILVSRAGGLYAQEYSYSQYDVKDGLSGYTVYCAVEDKDGFMWFGTETGLTRFDGTHFRNFTTRDGLPDNEIIRLSVDSRNRVWILPFKNSVAYYWKGKIHNQQNDSVLRKLKITTEVMSAVEDRAGDILIRERQSLHIISPEGKVYDINDAGGRQFSALAVGLNASGSYHLVMSIPLANSKADIDHYKLVLSKESHPFIYGQSFVYLSPSLEVTLDFKEIHFHGANGSTFDIPVPEGFNNLSRINDSLFTINSTNGAWLLDIRQKKITDSFLKGQTINSVVADQEGNLWFSTLGKGVYRLGSSQFVNYSFRVKNNTLPVSCIYKFDSTLYLGADHFWLWTMDEDRSHIRKTSIYEGGTRGRITSILKLPGNNTLIGTDIGLFRFLNGKLKIQFVPLAVKSCVVKDDSTLLVCSAQHALLVRTLSLATLDTIWNFRSTCGFIKDGLYYVGTLDGLCVIDKNKKISYPGDKFRSLKSRIADIREAADGVLWIATDGAGLIGYRDGRVIASITEDNGLTSNICRTLFISDKDIWVGTDKGLNKITRSGNNYQIASFARKDGLSSDIINSIYVEGNNVYVGTADGLTWFNENSISKRSECNLHIDRIAVSDKDWPSDTTGFHIPHDDNNIQFDFVGISYKSAGNITYQYRLKGLDNEWRTTSETSLRYPSLPSGAYELRLQAVNKFGVRSSMLIVNFIIDKLLWERTWFRLLILLSLALVVWLIFTYRIRSIRKKEAEKTQTVTKMAELEQMALRSQMNPHFIFNCMNSIQEYVIEKDVRGANEYITKFAKLIRQTLEISSKPFITLSEEINYISTYMELENHRFGNKFVNSVIVSEELDPQNLYIPPMILQPYIENAIRHGIGHRQDKKGRILVKMECRQHWFLCIIEDNGVGRRQANLYKSANAINYQSMGMTLVARRIDMLNKTNKIPILIGIEDLEDPATGPSGTRVTLSFPLEQATK
jgi:ligand-binding sensor domain-containing protein